MFFDVSTRPARRLATAVRHSLPAGVWAALTVGLLALVLFLRRPDSLLNPQFWAEDGTIFYSDAYHHGFWWTLTRPTAGYLNTVPRLVAGLAVLLPMHWAPLIFNLAAFLIQMVPVFYLLSNRMARWIPDHRLRVAAAFLYAVVPNSYETHAILDNSQWTLAFAGLLLLVADPPLNKRGKTYDVLVLTLLSCTGPFALILLPVALTNVARYRQSTPRSWFAAPAAVLTLGSATQILYLLTSERQPPSDTSWPTFQELLRILSTHVFFDSILGIRGTLEFSRSLTFVHHLAGLALTGLLAVLVMRSRNRALIGLLYLAAATICASFARPTSAMASWSSPAFGPRYYLFSSLFMLYAIMLLCVRKGRGRPLGVLLAVSVMFIGIPRDFVHPGDYTDPPRPDTHYLDQIAAFETRPAGARFYIPTQPEGWGGMALTKKTPGSTTSPLDALRMVQGEQAYVMNEPFPTTIPTSPEHSFLCFSGWAVDAAAQDRVGGVWLDIDGRLFPAVDGVENRSPERRAGNPRYRYSGFYREIPRSELEVGTHQLSMVVLTHDRKGYFRTPWHPFDVHNRGAPDTSP